MNVVVFFTAGSLGMSTPGAPSSVRASMPRVGPSGHLAHDPPMPPDASAPAPRSCDNLRSRPAAEPGGNVNDVSTRSERMSTPLRVLVVGCGNMGSSHARAYHADPGFDLAGVVDRAAGPRHALAAAARRRRRVRRLRHGRSRRRGRTAWPSAPIPTRTPP
ncbi:MAG: Gfo/Idh/MocA family oxidoreductase [Desulfobacterales bacterium]|nr:Gfo/Idh/MocA family oxidoreductase [Desulfobacterales bacterium]